MIFKLFSKKLYSLFILSLLFLFSVSFVNSSSLLVFSNYDTNIVLNSDNTLLVSKTIVIKNIGTEGLVPGQIEFKLPNDNGDVKVLNYSVKDGNGGNIKNSIRNSNDKSVIQIEIFQPLLPGFSYTVKLDYTLTYNPSGVIFNKFQIPLKEPGRLKILNGKINLKVPKGKTLTYVDYKDNSTKITSNTASWKIGKNTPKSVFFEYSYIPLKIANMAGSTVFWLFVNLVLILLLIREIRKHLISVRD